MTAALRLAVFDMDGTLIDSQLQIIAAMSRGFDVVGQPRPSDAAILSIVGLSLPETMRVLVPGADSDLTAALVNAYKDAFIALRAQSGGEAQAPLYPGARAALDRLAARDGLLLGVATGKAKRGLDHAIAAHKLHGIFHTQQTADGHPSKPHPSMLHACMAETGAAPQAAIMIGDTEFDIAMGRAAGMATIAVSWGYHPVDRLRAAGADLVIDHFDQLDAALDALWTEAAA
ncbi:MAG: phosphoglycolate phosphatase [Paracoccaceae bacterium]|jgi:phosphoglycolate phosphatase